MGSRHAHPGKAGEAGTDHRKHRLYDYFRDFIREQEAGAQAVTLAPCLPRSAPSCSSLHPQRLGQSVVEDYVDRGGEVHAAVL